MKSVTLILKWLLEFYVEMLLEVESITEVATRIPTWIWPLLPSSLSVVRGYLATFRDRENYFETSTVF